MNIISILIVEDEAIVTEDLADFCLDLGSKSSTKKDRISNIGLICSI